MRHSWSKLLVLSTALAPLPALAQSDIRIDEIVVTATRSVLPASALPLTIDVIGSDSLAQQAAISGSVIDAVSTLVPSFSPTRQKLSGAGETLRGRSPLYAINGIPQSTPLRDGSRDGFTIDPFFARSPASAAIAPALSTRRRVPLMKRAVRSTTVRAAALASTAPKVKRRIPKPCRSSPASVIRWATARASI
jgi:hypothetical protein